MARRRHLIAYDIADPKRLRNICKLMEDFGQRLQYSVFLCDLSAGELAELEAAAKEIMHLRDDSIIEIDLGPTSSPAHIRSIGRAREVPGSGSQIV
ncbi:CRISPR-associated endonuclease Cas2 [Actinobacteria bacterium YIM 96077]|uniref:CRISPR-associated endoribonuclease Cas2 n=1 Tax=Phytoactinopolyspora halophila TaxID=1981511 RepID=A0A329QCP5_9ACTN|nr:CRISPR-associated endonuclease Cas2 [Phytoactinopolyspora halophila]AYY13996.1 CRISPR-associated endonuclease Cas2 [Actinobacteria bacterium YIM 96077]RAW10027.1 CRISPR-associated endonuclease Cas2 [Phytoactinopolyspora halophila]